MDDLHDLLGGGEALHPVDGVRHLAEDGRLLVGGQGRVGHARALELLAQGRFLGGCHVAQAVGRPLGRIADALLLRRREALDVLGDPDPGLGEGGLVVGRELRPRLPPLLGVLVGAHARGAPLRPSLPAGRLARCLGVGAGGGQDGEARDDGCQGQGKASSHCAVLHE